MPKHLLLFLTLFCCVTKGFSQTHVSGNIQSNTTWTKANSPYILDGTVGVPSAYTLTIEPGVTVQRTADYEILINGLVTYSPSSNTLNTNAPVSSPKNVYKGAQSGGVAVVWSKNKESNIKNYKVYWGYVDAFTYAHSNTVTAIDSSYFISGAAITDSVAVTALNTNATGTNDQLSGSESWYTPAVIAVIKLLPTPPAISYTNTSLTYYIGQPVSPAAATNNGGTIPANYINNVTTFAGNGLLTLADGTGTNASFYYPAGLTTDGSGNIYVAEANSGAIRKITPAGVVTTLASISYPTGITSDAAGNLYVTDPHYNAIRKVAPNGSITTFAGSQPGDLDGTGTSARLYSPSAIVADASGNLFITDEGNHRIKKITPAGVVTTIAGSGISAFADGTGTSASFKTPHGITVDAIGNLYVADNADFRIRKITPAGVVTTFAGSGVAGTTDGTGIAASFTSPTNITIDATGNLYVTDFNLIRKITQAGVVTTIAGNTSLGSADGIGTAASFNNPWGIIVDADGNLVISDSFSKIRKLALTGYGITPALPAGLAISNTGTISGTPTAISATSAYTVTAANAAGTATTTLNIGTGLVPAPNISYSNAGNYPLHTPITPITPSNKGGNIPVGMYAQTTTLAGGSGAGSANGTGTAATFNAPQGMAVDPAGNIYVADRSNNLIRKITPAGVVTTFAGTGAVGSNNGTTSAATFNSPGGLAFDSNGNLLVADGNNHQVRKITPAGIVSTLAGDANGGYADGTGLAAKFTFPWGIVTDATGNAYITDTYNNVIRKITPAGVVTTFAGNPSAHGAANGTGTAATFNVPTSLAMDASGNLLVTDVNNNLIRKITPTGVVTTFAGNGQNTPVDGTGTAAGFNTPMGITIDLAGNIYVTESNLIRRITPQAVVTTLAGNGTSTSVNGIGTAAGFSSPFGLVTDLTGNLYVSGGAKSEIRKISLTGYEIKTALPAGLTFDETGTISGTPTTLTPAKDYKITAYNMGGSSTATINFAVTLLPAPQITYKSPQSYTINTAITPLSPTNSGGAVPVNIYAKATTIAGNGQAGNINGTGTAASFNSPSGLAVDAAGNTYVADAFNNSIRKITPDGVVSTFAGSGTIGFNDGTATTATFNSPFGLVFDGGGNLFVTDMVNHEIRKITPTGTVTTFAGGGTGSADGTGTAAKFALPAGIVIDASGNFYVSDLSNHTIRKITPTGVVTTFAGTTGVKGATNAVGTAASFNSPSGMAIDAAGNIYVADRDNYLIRKITPAGVVSTYAGTGVSGTTDGTTATATFGAPNNLTLDDTGNLYVTDHYSLIRMITPQGIVKTLAGSVATSSIDGIGASAGFDNPFGMAINTTGDLLIADRGTDHKIRKLAITGYNITPALPAGLSFSTAGTITGTPTLVTPAADYTVTAYNAGGSSTAKVNITVNKITPVLTFPALTNPTYGDADIALNVTSDNITTPINYTIDNPTVASVSGGKLHIKGAGTVNITVTQTADATHNAATALTRTVIINPKTISIAANTSSKIYGNADSTLTYNIVSGGLVGNDAFSGTLSRSTGENAGVYNITQGTLALNNNYKLTFSSNAFTIYKRILTVTANDVTWDYGKSTGFTLTYNGFANDEDVSKLTTQPTVTTTANPATPVAGVYDLVPRGGVSANYGFIYVNGKLTVTLPATNFKISTTSVTCKGSNNGIITITPVASLNYTAVVTGSGLNQTYHFKSTLTISNLSPATYHVCVSADNLPDNQQCSDIIITEPKDLAVYATVNKTVNTVTLALTGSDNYTVKLNGTEYQTSGNSITLPLTTGSNKISVSTDRLCQGTFEQLIDLSGITAPYPNPFQSTLYVNLGEQVSTVATISIFNMTNGRQVLSQRFNNQSGVVRLDVASLQTGVYTLNLTLDGKLSTFKIVKQ